MKFKDYELPDELLYNKDFSWVKVLGDVARVGVIEPGAKLVEEFVFVKLPEEGKRLTKGEVYVSLEALKWSGHLTSPLTGKVVKVNKEVYDKPSLINEDPYGKGWIMEIEIENKDELKDLLDAKQVIEWLKEKIRG